MNYDLVTILGPTASGKTPLAAALAYRLNAEIISGDSRQVYRRMDLGTGKDLADYVVDGKRIPYHLIDIVEPGYKYNVFEFQRDFLQAYDEIRQRGVLPILCGGTGMYIESVLKGYKLLPVPENPELRASLADKSLDELTTILAGYKKLHNSTDVDTVKRAIRAIEIEEYYRQQPVSAREFPAINSLVIGVDIDRDLRRTKITRRLKQRLDEGMVDEVRALLDAGIPAEDLPKVKEKFYKANQTVRGSGIGLAVADEIMNLHHGSLDIESGEGVGTTVTLTFPIYKEGDEDQPQTENVKL